VCNRVMITRAEKIGKYYRVVDGYMIGTKLIGVIYDISIYVRNAQTSKNRVGRVGRVELSLRD
jgi:hypothetical protein